MNWRRPPNTCTSAGARTASRTFRSSPPDATCRTRTTTGIARGYETAVAGRDKPGSEKVRLVESLGLEYVDTESTDFGELAAKGTTWDLVVEAAGVGWLVFEVAKALSPRGALALTGIAFGGKEATVDANRFMTEMVVRNRLVVGSVNAAMRDQDLLAVSAGENVIRLLPPLIVSEAEIDEGVRRFDAALTVLDRARATPG